MNFLEANRILSRFEDGEPLPLRLAASGNVEPLLLYVKAAAAARGRRAELATLPYGTLGQFLAAPVSDTSDEIVLLMPWDFVPECDWRSGILAETAHPGVLLQAAHEITDRLANRRSKVVYLPAPLPPLYADPAANATLAAGVCGLAAGLGAHILNAEFFTLGAYLASGVPVAGSRAGDFAEVVVDLSLGLPEGSAKVLVADLDNVLWAGLAAEEGPEGVRCDPDGIGYRHFLFQSLMRRLKANGVLLAAVSRNDLEVARAPIAAGKTLLSESDFIEILATYEAKSSQLRRLQKALNLGPEAFVFVDDNPVELAEVAESLPQVKCLQFPAHDDELADFLQKVSAIFARRSITAEDRQRTEMYRRRLAAMELPVGDGQGADLSEFLSKLRMELSIHERSSGPRERAVQLINKTNQFNLNGRRWGDDEIAKELAAGGRLFTAKLDDRSGSHGEILACLVDKDLCLRAFVLSCRVFQRRVEYAFLCWLLRRLGADLGIAFRATERNTPIRNFLSDPAFTQGARETRIDGAKFLASHESALELFKVTEARVD